MEEVPSQVIDKYWILAYPKSDSQKETLRSGKWLIFTNATDVDELWAKIKKATEEGKLGYKSKVSTAKVNSLAKNSNSRVICIYTYDSSDYEDVKCIREELRTFGISNKIPYKTNEDTKKGKYGFMGDKHISKYYE